MYNFEPIISEFCEIYNVSQDGFFDVSLLRNFLNTKYNNNLNTKENKCNLTKYLKDYLLNKIKINLTKVIFTKLKINNFLKYLNTGKLTTNILYISGSTYYTKITDFQYYHYSNFNEPNSYLIKSKIIYDTEKFKQHYLNYFVKYNLTIDKLFIILQNSSKNYIKYRYLLCIISIMRQKYNFQDYAFCNYFISFF